MASTSFGDEGNDIGKRLASVVAICLLPSKTNNMQPNKKRKRVVCHLRFLNTTIPAETVTIAAAAAPM